MSGEPKSTRFKSILRRFPVLVAGLLVFIIGVYLETRNRTNDEDIAAWCVLAIGASLIGAGMSIPLVADIPIPFVRPMFILLIAILSPFVAFAFALTVFWSVILLLFIVRTVFIR